MRNNIKKILAPQNRKFLIAGIAAAAIGTYLIAGDKIKALLKKDETPEPPTIDPQPVIAPVQSTTPVTVVQQVVEPTASNTFNPDQRLKKGDKNDLVKRLQIILNDIYYSEGYKNGEFKNILDDNYNIIGSVTIPIQVDGVFGNITDLALKGQSQFYKDNNYITIDQARLMWAYVRGINNKSFPDSLRSSSRYQRYADKYKAAKIDYAKRL